MSWFNRRSLLLLPLVLAACGFQPAYGPGGAAAGLPGRIHAADPVDRNGFDLVTRLEERLGRPQTGAYDLAYAITTNAVGVGITTENAITRYNLSGRVEWTVSAPEGGAVILSGRAEGFTAWSATGTTVAGLAAEEDARRRLMRQLADQIVAQLIAQGSALVP